MFSLKVKMKVKIRIEFDNEKYKELVAVGQEIKYFVEFPDC